MRLFLKRSIENLIKNRSGNLVIHDSIHLYLLFLMVKTGALYLVSIKSYSKNTHPPFFEMSASVIATQASETHTIEMLLS